MRWTPDRQDPPQGVAGPPGELGVSSHRTRLLILVVTSIILAFAFQGSRGLYETTEGRYAESAREMRETGNWLVPQLDYQPHWTKPPLTYWAIAGGMAVLGENEWGVRAASAVSYLVVVFAVYALGTAMWGKRAGFASGLIYATSPFAVIASNSVSTDPLLAMWEALAALAYWESTSSDRPGSSRWIVLFWLFAGLGFLTKGPPALLTPLVVFIYHGWRRARGRVGPSLSSPLGLALFLVIGFGWFVTVGLMHEGLIGQLIHQEVLGRVADPDLNRNPGWYGPFAIILIPFLASLGPWVVYWRRAWRAFLSWGGWRERLKGLGDREAVLFCVLWAFLPVGLLCLPRSRLPLYVLPFVPALALLTGRSAIAVVSDRRSWSRFLRLGLATGLVLLAVKGVVPHLSARSDVRPVYEYLKREADAAPSGSGSGASNVYAYGLEQEYGLMFYLRGRMTRVLDKEGSMEPDELIEALSDTSRSEDEYVVARARSDRLLDALDRAGLPFERGAAGSYHVFRVHPANSTRGQAPALQQPR